MAMLYAAYFDASGKNEGYPVLTVAGAVAPVKKWIRFERDWNRILQAEQVTEFHATDFAASAGDYAGWKGDKTRRSAFLARLIEVVKNNTNKLFSVSVELASWRKIDREYYLSEHFYSPYALAAFTVMTQTMYWAKSKRVKPPEFVFEDGDDGWHGLLALAKWLNVVPIRLPKVKAVPCQIGDMIAWKSRITATNSLKRLRHIERNESSRDLVTEATLALAIDLANLNRLKVRPGSINIFADKTLTRLCNENRIPRRATSLSLPVCYS